MCGKPLSQDEFDKALGLWQQKQEHIKHLEEEQKKLKIQAQNFGKEKIRLRKQAKEDVAEQIRRFNQRLKEQRQKIERSFARQIESKVKKGIADGVVEEKEELKRKSIELRKSNNKMAQLHRSLELSTEKYEKANDEIKALKEQIKSGITPQREGLLEEGRLLEELEKLFPQDKFEHHGKGGDIIQIVIAQSRSVGKIVYECKKVKQFSKGHIEQAKKAREFREADFAVLVTNAFPSKKQHYFVEKTVFVISPLSLEPVIHTLRESLVRMAMLKMSNSAKVQAVQKVYDYLSSNEYNNKVNVIASQLEELGKDLKSEMDSHKRIWSKRYNIYSGMYDAINLIDNKLKSIVHQATEKPKLLPAPRKEFVMIEGLGK